MVNQLKVNFVKFEDGMYHYNYSFEHNNKSYTLNFAVNNNLSESEMIEQAKDGMEYCMDYGISNFY